MHLISDFGIGVNSQFYLPEAELYLAKYTFNPIDSMKFIERLN